MRNGTYLERMVEVDLKLHEHLPPSVHWRRREVRVTAGDCDGALFQASSALGGVCGVPDARVQEMAVMLLGAASGRRRDNTLVNRKPLP